jgi:hypothetical protein
MAEGLRRVLPSFGTTRWLAAMLAFLALVAPALAETRIALVVGNAGYQAVVSLENAVHDARLMAATLETRGFQTTLLTDADRATLTRAVGEFGRALREAGSEATGLFYYAGHGVQSFGTNYLLPVDARLTDAADLALVAVEAEAVLRQMASARNLTNIVILDACRNNPFQGIPDMNDNGLAEMKAPTGTFLAYSTAPGAVALDGTGGNSPFTRALAAQIAIDGQPIEQLFRSARVAVLEETNGAQTPWDASSLTREFFFTPPVVVSAEELADAQLWDSVRATRDPVQIMLFLRGYPSSRFAVEARQLLGELIDAELEPSAPAPPAAAAPPQVPGADEQELMAKAQASGDPADYQAYLDAYPTGVFAELARTELKAIGAQLAAAAPPPEVVETPAAPAPAPLPSDSSGTLPSSVSFSTPLRDVDAEIDGRSIEELIRGAPLYPPIDGLPEELWKGQTCSNCHAWTRDALCDQARTYLGASAERSLQKPHPLGAEFKSVLGIWAAGDCR